MPLSEDEIQHLREVHQTYLPKLAPPPPTVVASDPFTEVAKGGLSGATGEISDLIAKRGFGTEALDPVRTAEGGTTWPYKLGYIAGMMAGAPAHLAEYTAAKVGTSLLPKASLAVKAATSSAATNAILNSISAAGQGEDVPTAALHGAGMGAALGMLQPAIGGYINERIGRKILPDWVDEATRHAGKTAGGVPPAPPNLSGISASTAHGAGFPMGAPPPPPPPGGFAAWGAQFQPKPPPGGGGGATASGFPSLHEYVRDKLLQQVLPMIKTVGVDTTAQEKFATDYIHAISQGKKPPAATDPYMKVIADFLDKEHPQVVDDWATITGFKPAAAAAGGAAPGGAAPGGATGRRRARGAGPSPGAAPGAAAPGATPPPGGPAAGAGPSAAPPPGAGPGGAAAAGPTPPPPPKPPTPPPAGGGAAAAGPTPTPGTPPPSPRTPPPSPAGGGAAAAPPPGAAVTEPTVGMTPEEYADLKNWYEKTYENTPRRNFIRNRIQEWAESQLGKENTPDRQYITDYLEHKLMGQPFDEAPHTDVPDAKKVILGRHVEKQFDKFSQEWDTTRGAEPEATAPAPEAAPAPIPEPAPTAAPEPEPATAEPSPTPGLGSQLDATAVHERIKKDLFAYIDKRYGTDRNNKNRRYATEYAAAIMRGMDPAEKYFPRPVNKREEQIVEDLHKRHFEIIRAAGAATGGIQDDIRAHITNNNELWQHLDKAIDKEFPGATLKAQRAYAKSLIDNTFLETPRIARDYPHAEVNDIARQKIADFVAGKERELRGVGPRGRALTAETGRPPAAAPTPEEAPKPTTTYHTPGGRPPGISTPTEEAPPAPTPEARAVRGGSPYEDEATTLPAVRVAAPEAIEGEVIPPTRGGRAEKPRVTVLPNAPRMITQRYPEKTPVPPGPEIPRGTPPPGMGIEGEAPGTTDIGRPAGSATIRQGYRPPEYRPPGLGKGPDLGRGPDVGKGPEIPKGRPPERGRPVERPSETAERMLRGEPTTLPALRAAARQTPTSTSPTINVGREIPLPPERLRQLAYHQPEVSPYEEAATGVLPAWARRRTPEVIRMPGEVTPQPNVRPKTTLPPRTEEPTESPYAEIYGQTERLPEMLRRREREDIENRSPYEELYGPNAAQLPPEWRRIIAELQGRGIPIPRELLEPLSSPEGTSELQFGEHSAFPFPQTAAAVARELPEMSPGMRSRLIRAGYVRQRPAKEILEERFPEAYAQRPYESLTDALDAARVTREEARAAASPSTYDEDLDNWWNSRARGNEPPPETGAVPESPEIVELKRQIAAARAEHAALTGAQEPAPAGPKPKDVKPSLRAVQKNIEAMFTGAELEGEPLELSPDQRKDLANELQDALYNEMKGFDHMKRMVMKFAGDTSDTKLADIPIDKNFMKAQMVNELREGTQATLEDHLEPILDLQYQPRIMSLMSKKDQDTVRQITRDWEAAQAEFNPHQTKIELAHEAVADVLKGLEGKSEKNKALKLAQWFHEKAAPEPTGQAGAEAVEEAKAPVVKEKKGTKKGKRIATEPTAQPKLPPAYLQTAYGTSLRPEELEGLTGKTAESGFGGGKSAPDVEDAIYPHLRRFTGSDEKTQQLINAAYTTVGNDAYRQKAAGILNEKAKPVTPKQKALDKMHKKLKPQAEAQMAENPGDKEVT